MKLARWLVLLSLGCTAVRQDLGHDDDAASDVSESDAGRVGIVRLAAGHRTSMALDGDGTVWAWGVGANGQLALAPSSLSETCTIVPGPSACTSRPVRVPALAGVSELALGRHHGCALRDGRVLCWGLGLFGSLGTGSISDDGAAAPVDVGIADAVAIGVSEYTSCAVHADGAVSCWGLASAGSLGIAAAALDSCVVAASWVARFEVPFAAGTALPCALRPTRVVGLAEVEQVAPGRHHLCARTASDVRCMGSAEAGQLGSGDTMGGRIAPVVVAPATAAAVGLGSGALHSCALAADALTCWGGDGLGQAGLLPAPLRCGATGCVPTASAVAFVGAGPLGALALGALHTCVVTGTEAWCFGNANAGASGARSEACEAGPCRTMMAGRTATDVRAPIAAGSEHTCVSALEGGVLCWGEGSGGALGGGARTTSTAPVRVDFPAP